MAVGKIQRTPRGLLQFLGMVGTGVPPTLMADEVRAIVPILPFYGKDLLEVVGASAAGALSAVGNTVVAAVPSGEAWIPVSGQYGMTVGAAGERIAASFRIRIGNSQLRIHSTPLATAIAAAAELTFGFVFPQPLILTAGNEIQVHVDDINVAAARAGNVFAMVYRFRI